MFTFLHLILMWKGHILSTDGDALRAPRMAVEKGCQNAYPPNLKKSQTLQLLLSYHMYKIFSYV